MSSDSRVKNSGKNIIINIIVQIVTFAVSFISRRVFNDVLGAEYLGISGLFSNVLSVLSLTEMGVSAAVMYNLYKPIAENDHIRVAKIINFYKSMYNMIGCAIFVIGVCLIPFLKYIVNLSEVELDNSTLYFYYFLLLLNSVLSYFFVYKTAVITADQKGYKLKFFNIAFSVIQLILQIAVLLVFRSYTGYIIVQIICGLLLNIVTSTYSQKKYPYIKKKVFLEKKEKKDILLQVKDMFSYQIGSVILNNTDNILISVMDSTKMVGLYSNYTSIINAVTSFSSLLFSSIQASIGNYLVKTSEKKHYDMFKLLTFIAFIIYTVASVGIYEFMGDIIQIWFNRSDYVLSQSLLATCVFNFYISGILYPIWSYRNTIGLFKYTKNVMFFTAAINLVLSVVLGKVIGVVGILLATGISRIVTTVWYEPYILFKVYFKHQKNKLINYYLKQLFYIGQTILALVLVNYITSLITLESLVLRLLIKFIICIVVCAFVIVVFNFKSYEFKTLFEYGTNILKKVLRR